jgi:tripartite-type tricarboxylate transporter receptor subunit TctC
MFSFLKVATPGVETRPAVRGADEFAAFIKTEMDKWTKVIKAARLKAD